MLAERIKQYRMAVGMTQKELAGANASQNTISQYESGKRTPTVKRLLEISAILGCSVNELTVPLASTDAVGYDKNEDESQ